MYIQAARLWRNEEFKYSFKVPEFDLLFTFNEESEAQWHVRMQEAEVRW
jgi:hypothetical protein